MLYEVITLVEGDQADGLALLVNVSVPTGDQDSYNFV